MERLGYDRYVAQGGDWGNAVTEQLALLKPPGLLGIHTNMPATLSPEISKGVQAGDPAPEGLSADEKKAYEILVHFFATGTGYAGEMGNRPQTLYGIVDSPVGLAAWMLDHDEASYELIARAFAGNPGGLSRDDVLDNVTHYWLTNSGISSARLYWESKLGFFDVKGVELPVGVTRLPGRALPGTAELGGEGLSQAHPLQPRRRRRPFRRLGAAADASRRSSGRPSGRCADRGARGRSAAARRGRAPGPRWRDRLAQLRPPDAGRASREGRRRPVLHLLLRQLAAHAALRHAPGTSGTADHGLVVIGAHSPEFRFEHDVEKIRSALEAMGVAYPIAIDNDFAIWRAFDNKATGPRSTSWTRRAGSGIATSARRTTSAPRGSSSSCFPRRGATGSMTNWSRSSPTASTLPADWDTLRSPETYVGYARATGLRLPAAW